MSFSHWIVLGLSMAAAAVPGGSPQDAAGAGKQDALSLMRVTSDIAGHIRFRSFNGYLAIYIPSDKWDAASKDSDLGMFLTIKDARTKPVKNGRSAACLFSPDKDLAVCVYFDGDVPFAVTTAKAGASGRIDPHRVEVSYRAVSKEMLKKGEQKLDFNPSGISTDDGVALPAWVIQTHDCHSALSPDDC